jgi:hypothetical protein
MVVAAAISAILDYEKFGDKHTYDERCRRITATS